MAVSGHLHNLFDNLDFTTIAANPDFKEDSVRKVIILPILKALQYPQQDIIKSKTLQHPDIKVGSKNERSKFYFN